MWSSSGGSRTRTIAAFAVALAGCQLVFPLNGYDGPSDGAVRDVSTPVAIPCSQATGAILCDGFENDIDSNLWRRSLQGAEDKLVVDQAHVHRGSRSFHAQAHVGSADAGDVGGVIVHEATLPATLFVRVFIYMSSSQPAMSTTALAFVVVMQGELPNLGMNLSVVGGAIQITDWADSMSCPFAGAPGCTKQDNGSLAPGIWHCVEWEINRGPTAMGETRVWQDGSELLNLHLTGLTLPLDDNLKLGLQTTSPPIGDYDVWLDDIYVDTSPIGCDK